MKKLLIPALLIYLIIYSGEVTGQDCFIVMKIKGTIVLESNGKTLQKDDQICSSDNVIFKSKDAAAIVHSSSKGRYTLKANKSRISEIEGLIVSAVSSALSKSKSSLDTRSGNPPKDEISINRYCVIDSYELSTDLNYVPDDCYFILGLNLYDKALEIKLRNNGNIVYIDRETILIPEIKASEQEYIDDAAIYLCCNSSEFRKTVDAFDITFPGKKNLVKELFDYSELLKASGKSDEAIEEELVKYTEENYGSINKEEFLKEIRKEVLKK